MIKFEFPTQLTGQSRSVAVSSPRGEVRFVDSGTGQVSVSILDRDGANEATILTHLDDKDVQMLAMLLATLVESRR